MHNILYMAYEFLFQGSTFEKIFRKEQKSLKKEKKQVSIRCGQVVRDFESEAKTTYNL